MDGSIGLGVCGTVSHDLSGVQIQKVDKNTWDDLGKVNTCGFLASLEVGRFGGSRPVILRVNDSLDDKGQKPKFEPLTRSKAFSFAVDKYNISVLGRFEINREFNLTGTNCKEKLSISDFRKLKKDIDAYVNKQKQKKGFFTSSISKKEEQFFSSISKKKNPFGFSKKTQSIFPSAVGFLNDNSQYKDLVPIKEKLNDFGNNFNDYDLLAEFSYENGKKAIQSYRGLKRGLDIIENTMTVDNSFICALKKDIKRNCSTIKEKLRINLEPSKAKTLRDKTLVKVIREKRKIDKRKLFLEKEILMKRFAKCMIEKLKETGFDHAYAKMDDNPRLIFFNKQGVRLLELGIVIEPGSGGESSRLEPELLSYIGTDSNFYKGKLAEEKHNTTLSAPSKDSILYSKYDELVKLQKKSTEKNDILRNIFVQLGNLNTIESYENELETRYGKNKS